MSSSNNSDTIKRLILSAATLVKQIDASNSKAKTIRDLFTPDSIELRNQLSYLCGKSIVADPLQCRRKAEEILWKKCFYSVVTFAKISSKKAKLTALDKFYLENHINTGITKFTEHLQDVCSRLENLDPPVKNVNVFVIQDFKQSQTESKESKEDLLESVQKILIWMGDLMRYSVDLEISGNVMTAQQLYQQAMIVNPTVGLPFNQLGTLTSHDSSRSFESTFFYLRSLKAAKVFPGAGSNLKTLLVKMTSSEETITSSFAQLLIKLIFETKPENAYEIAQLCQVALGEVQGQLQQGSTSDYDRLLDLTASIMLCSTFSGSETSSNKSTAAVAFCCSLFSQLLVKFQEIFHLGANSVQQNELKPKDNKQTRRDCEEDEMSEDEEESRRAKLRRRKVTTSGSSDQEEFSEEELFIDTDDSEDESEEEAISESGFHSADVKSEPQLEIPVECTALLPLFKLLTDWLQVNTQVMSSQSVRTMWISLAEVLNVLRRCQREDVERYKQLPLEEDWKFYKVPIMASVHSAIDFDTSGAPSKCTLILNSIRIERILSFGKWLAEQDEHNGFQMENGVFTCLTSETMQNGANAHPEEDSNKEGLMRNMAHLWLQSEVQELERNLSPQPKQRKKKGNSEFATLPFVFVVPDVSALTDFTHTIKGIVKSQKLIVVIPNAVISEMDQLKKDSSSVRDCIRWLETCFKNGNRFVRAQRQNEHQVIPLLTYPKRKDKMNWILFQILECCHYLDTNQRNTYKANQNSPIVLFLTGNLLEEGNQQAKGLCSSIGIELRTADSLTRKGKTKKDNDSKIRLNS